MVSSPEPLEPAEITEIVLPNKQTLAAIVSPIVSGDVLGRVAVMRDITHLKELDQMKSDFVQSASHELRNPLQVMSGYAGLLLEEGELDGRQREWVDQIRSGVHQMTELIDNLLDIPKIESGVDVNMVDTPVRKLIEDVVAAHQAHAREKDLDLSADLAPDLPSVQADATLVRQAVSNLVENAIKYTPSGFIRVRAAAHAERGELVISVRDSGLGIAEEAQGRLFQKFYRVKSRDTVNIFGTGLGLAIVKSIADLHHGRVWVESEPHEGSTFHLALPLSTNGP